MNEQYIDTIHRYLNGIMPAAEREAFEAEIRTNPELQEDVETERLLLAGLERSGQAEIQKTIQNVHQKLKTEGFFESVQEKETPSLTVSHSSKRTPMNRILAIAASLVILAGVVWFFTRGGAPVDPETLFANNYRPDADLDRAKTTITSLESMGMAGVTTDSDTLRQALQLYEDGQLEEAQKMLTDLFAAHPDNETTQYYLGVVHMAQSHYAKAIELLLPLSRSESADYKNEALWNLGLCYLKTENGVEDAREAFLKLSNDNEYPNHRGAKAVLDQLLPK